MKRAAITFALVMMTTSAMADEWIKMARKQIDLGNKPTRACSKHTGTCTNAIRAGDYIMIELESAAGAVAARVICQFNQHRDRRTCVDFDTKHRRIEVLADGMWVEAR
jgi:hypothetical protein